MPGPLHQHVQHPCRTIDCLSRQQRQARRAATRQKEAEEAIEETETVGIVVKPPKVEEATTDKLVNGAMENDTETAEISEESSNCKNSVSENVAAAKVDVDGELCPDELHYPEIYGKIAFICFQCEYITKNYIKGDEIYKHYFISFCVEDIYGCQNVINVENISLD